MIQIPSSRLLGPLLITLGVLLGWGGLSLSESFSRVGEGFNDTLTHKLQYPYNRHQDDIVIIKIDDKSLDTLPQSDIGVLAFDKGVYALALEKLFEEYHVAAVGIDIVFANASVLGQADEEKLRETLERYKERVVIATRSDGNPYPLCLYSEALHGAIDTPASERIRRFTLSYDYQLSESCAQSSVHPDNSETIEGLAYRTLRLALPQRNPLTAPEALTKLEQFKNTQELFPLSYYTNGRNNTGTLGFQSYSLIDILEGKTTQDDGSPIDLERKIILIGEVGTLIHDSHLTPIHSDIKMPGVEINANIMQTLLDLRYIRDIPFLLYLALLLLLSGSVIWSVFRLSLFWSLALVSLGVILLSIFGAILFVSDIFFDIFFGVVYIVLLFSALYLYRFVVVDKDKRKLKKQFSLYVSADVVDDISHNPDSVILAGEERDMSIFFSDIVGFTSISESLTPRELLELLNEYFSEMTRIIQEYKGTIDKFIGDSVMCFFNAPLELKNHSYFACKAALMQQKRLKELREKWKLSEKKELHIRIGLHAGKAIHGNIGSSQTHVNYTVIGDSVNLASRLEGICKEYGISICCSESIYTTQKDAFHFRELDTLRVKGKGESVKIYELLGSQGHEIPETAQKIFSSYALGLTRYQLGDYVGAKEIWSKNIYDNASKMMSERCNKIISGEIVLEDGAYVMTHK